eukprot:1155891-Pelagomonas_calceolata.AAC.9
MHRSVSVALVKLRWQSVDLQAVYGCLAGYATQFLPRNFAASFPCYNSYATRCRVQQGGIHWYAVRRGTGRG